MNAHDSDLNRIGSLIVSRWYVVAGTVLAVVAVALGYVATAAPRYEATAKVFYQPPDRMQGGIPFSGVLPTTGDAVRDMQTLVELAEGQKVVVKGAAAARTGAEQFEGATAVRVGGKSQILDFVATSGSKQEAAAFANAYAKAFVADRRDAMEPRIKAKLNPLRARLAGTKLNEFNQAIIAQDRAKLDELQAQSETLLEAVSMSDAASVPAAPIWPRPMLTLFVAVFVGIGLGIGMALLTARTETKLTEGVEELPAPLMGKVPRTRSSRNSGPLAPSAVEPMVADSFAALGSRLMADYAEETANVVLITSARASEGKSSVAANVATALAHGGRRVVLVDADMRQPTQHVVFAGLQGRPGLSQVLAGIAPVEQALVLVSPNLAAIASGPRHPNASSLLASVGFGGLVERLRSICDIVVIDAPPVLPVPDALAMAPHAQQVLLCGRVGFSDLAELREAQAKVAAASAAPQGFVMVGTTPPMGYGYDQTNGRAALPQLQAGPPPQIVDAQDSGKVA